MANASRGLDRLEQIDKLLQHLRAATAMAALDITYKSATAVLRVRAKEAAALAKARNPTLPVTSSFGFFGSSP